MFRKNYIVALQKSHMTFTFLHIDSTLSMTADSSDGLN